MKLIERGTDLGQSRGTGNESGTDLAVERGKESSSFFSIVQLSNCKNLVRALGFYVI